MVERLTDDQCIEALDAYEQWGNEAEAAASLNIPRTTLHNRLIAARKRQLRRKLVAEKPSVLPVFPDDDIDTEEILDHMERRTSCMQSAR